MARLVRAGFRPEAAAPLAREICAPRVQRVLALAPGIHLTWDFVVDNAQASCEDAIPTTNDEG